MVFALMVPSAVAQVQLIVRVEGGTGLRSAVAGGPVGLQAADASLADGIERVQPLLAPASQSGAAFLQTTFILDVADSTTADAVLARWQAAAGVAYAQYNQSYRLDPALHTAPDPLLDSLYHLDMIGAPAAWAVTTGQPDVRIGFIDTGVYFDHPDLRGQFWIHPGEDLNGNGRVDPSDWNGIDDDGNGYADDLRGYDFVDRVASVEVGDFSERDPDPSEDTVPGGGRGHGTIVAGVLGAARDNGAGITGIAPGTRLVPLRAFGVDGLAEDDDIAAAIVYAADLGLDVLNLSFGDVYISPLMRDAIRYAHDRGTVVVASAGNVGGDRPHYPSDYPDVISVAWLTQDGTGIAGRGTYGAGIELGAPGSSIYTTLLPGSSEAETAELYGRRSGSSLAAPMVSAAAALLMSIAPDLSPAGVRAVLTATAADIGADGWDHRTAAGRLDLGAALLRALPARTEITAPGHNTGSAASRIAIVGSAVDPGFRAYSVYVAPEVPGEAPAWQRLAGPVERQVLRDTLATWPVDDRPEGAYLIRLVTELRTGSTVEERSRIFLDRSAPQIDVRLLDRALVADGHGITADVQTDDLTDMLLLVELNGTTYDAASDRQARRHGLAWQDPTRRGGLARVTIEATNTAGMTTRMERTVAVPPYRPWARYFDEYTLEVPHGFLLPEATDFDGDGLLEITFNQYEDGWIGDTLAIYEWDGVGFTAAQRLAANVIPRDAGDADGDGLRELLTQVTGATLLLEQPDPTSYPTAEAFLDTTGLADPFDEASAFGARITDLDGDGRGELLVHNTSAWRVLEYDGATFTEAARLDNPTGTGASEVDRNEFQEPEAVVHDLDGDGVPELLVGDSDGDWIAYRATGNDRYEVIWTHETDRYNAGSRFAVGDLDGDGRPEVVTFTQPWTQATRDGEFEPAIGRYFLWKHTGDDLLTLVDTLAIWGNASRHGAMQVARFDGDGRAELVIVHPPDLFVLGVEDDRLQVRYQGTTAAGDGLRSMALVAADFDGDGIDELIAAAADERLHRFVPKDALASARPPPQWIRAAAIDDDEIRLEWTAQGADSVSVYGAPLDKSLELFQTVTVSSWIDTTEVVHRYMLRGWQQGEPSAWSAVRVVRPHAPATVVAVDFPGEGHLRLRFSQPLPPVIQPDRFRFDHGDVARSALVAETQRAVVLGFEELPATADTLRWEPLLDAEGTPVAQTAVYVAPPPRVERTLVVESWEVLSNRQVRLVFNQPLDPAEAVRPEHYEVTPGGMVTTVGFDPQVPRVVTLDVAGRPIGATGAETVLHLHALRSADGHRLAEEGTTISLVQPADDLEHVYVYPNPHRASMHDARVIIAGLPEVATIQVVSVQGVLIRTLEEQGGNGGAAWDLRDEQGEAVPSGVYLIRVESPGHDAVLRKVALIH